MDNQRMNHGPPVTPSKPPGAGAAPAPPPRGAPPAPGRAPVQGPAPPPMPARAGPGQVPIRQPAPPGAAPGQVPARQPVPSGAAPAQAPLAPAPPAAPAKGVPPAVLPEPPAPRAQAPNAGQPSLLKDLGVLLAKIACIVLAAVLLFTFLYGLHRTAEPSMKPAVQDGDLLLFYRLDRAYVAADVLLLQYEGQTQVRRVVAVAGDVVDITEAGLMINGALQQEQDIYQRTERYVDGVSFPLTVGEGQVFVLADAREGATDSRVYGAVNEADTLGTVITILRRRGI